jgi:hypothetical protein
VGLFISQVESKIYGRRSQKMIIETRFQRWSTAKLTREKVTILVTKGSSTSIMRRCRLKVALANDRCVQLRALEAINLEDASQEPGARIQNSEFRNELRSAQLSENLTSHAQVED